MKIDAEAAARAEIHKASADMDAVLALAEKTLDDILACRITPEQALAIAGDLEAVLPILEARVQRKVGDGTKLHLQRYLCSISGEHRLCNGKT
jgi:hypothetical protein